MFFLGLWVVTIIATLAIAKEKNLSFGFYFFLSLILGPLALVIALITPEVKSEDIVKTPTGVSLQEAQEQLRCVKASARVLEKRVNELEELLKKLNEAESDPLPAKEEVSHLTIAEKPDEVRHSAKAMDVELNFGRHWLNKIGMIVLALGVGFLITYTFKDFGPFLKIAFGYLVAGVLFYLGLNLETKNKFVYYGRVLLGGAWAIVYFTTYAMHHFEASRIISSQAFDLFLLALVSIGIIAHVLKYRSESMMSVALFVAYATSTIGHITSFTVLSSLLLSLMVLFFVYKFQWIKSLVLGILLTYGIHCVWVMPRIAISPENVVFIAGSFLDYHLLLNFVFLTAYWLVFLIGVHLIRSFQDPRQVNVLAGVNFANIAIYGIVSFSLLLDLFPVQRFFIILGLGIVYLLLALAMKKAGREELYISDIVAAVFTMTFSLSIKFLPTTTLLLWLAEIPFLLLVGIRFKERIFRYLSFALSVAVACRFIWQGSFYGATDISFLGLVWAWQEFMSFWAGISMGTCFYLMQRMKKEENSDADKIFDHVFSASACVYFSYLLLSVAEQPWRTLAFSTEGLALVAFGIFSGLKRLRAYAYLVLGLSAGMFIADPMYAASKALTWLIASANILIFFVTYFSIKYLSQLKKDDLVFNEEIVCTFWAGIVLLVVGIFQHVSPQWISLSLGISGVGIVLIGILREDKAERLGGLLILMMTLGRVVFVDLSGLDVIFKIFTFIILGVLFVGISFAYNRFN